MSWWGHLLSRRKPRTSPDLARGETGGADEKILAELTKRSQALKEKSTQLRTDVDDYEKQRMAERMALLGREPGRDVGNLREFIEDQAGRARRGWDLSHRSQELLKEARGVLACVRQAAHGTSETSASSPLLSALGELESQMSTELQLLRECSRAHSFLR